MSFKFFTVSIQDNGDEAALLNGFLQGHKVLSIERRWVEQGSFSFWSFCVNYLDGNAPAFSPSRGSNGRGKLDYRELLQPEDFAVFARLRDWRKQVAQAEAVPVYTIFTNEQLAQMVQTRTTTRPGKTTMKRVGKHEKIL